MALTRASLLQTLLVAATAVPLTVGCGGKTSDDTDTTTGPGGGGGTSSGSSGQGGSTSSVGGAGGAAGTTTSVGGTGGSPIAGAGGALTGGSGGAAGAATTGGAGGVTTAGTSGKAGSGGGVSTGGAAGGGGGTSKIPCDSPVPVLVDGKETGFVTCGNGVVVRAEAKVCPNLLSASSTCGSPGDGFICHSNADCKGGVGPYGYCGQGYGFGPPCECLTGCVQDSDCASDEICQCGDPIGRCVKTTCHTGADCAEGSCAQVAVGTPGCTSNGFACQTKTDQCQTDMDCPSNGGFEQCHVDMLSGARQCDPQQCAVGRPLVVEQAWRLATLTAGAAWG